MSLSFKSKNTSQLFIQATALFWLVAKLLSFKLWLSDRIFPIIPPFDFLICIPNQVHFGLLIVSIICLVWCIAKPQQQRVLVIVIIAEIASCLLDQNRWQPWEYQYIFMFFVLWFNRKNESIILLLLLIIFASTYFYSGLQKVNPHFIRTTWKYAVLEKYLHLPIRFTQNNWMLRLGYIIPLIEISLGIGILFTKTRKFVLAVIILMHVLLLIVIGPWGINYNKIVWPWNLAMIVYAAIIWNKQIEIDAIKKLRFNFNYITLIAWLVLPILSFYGYWDHYFSSSLYSGKNELCYIKIENPPSNFELAKYYKKKEIIDITNTQTIPLHIWAMDELGTPPCPQKRVFKKIKLQWAKKYPNIKTTFLMIDKSGNKKNVVVL